MGQPAPRACARAPAVASSGQPRGDGRARAPLPLRALGWPAPANSTRVHHRATNVTLHSIHSLSFFRKVVLLWSCFYFSSTSYNNTLTLSWISRQFWISAQYKLESAHWWCRKNLAHRSNQFRWTRSRNGTRRILHRHCACARRNNPNWRCSSFVQFALLLSTYRLLPTSIVLLSSVPDFAVWKGRRLWKWNKYVWK